MLDTVITNGTVVTAEQVAQVDIGIRDGTIIQFAAPGELDGEANHVVDASNRLVLPGFIDSHVHVNLELGEYTTTDSFRDLTRAAAHGGVTTVIPFAIPDPGEGPMAALQRRRQEARNDAYVDYSFHGCLTDASSESLQQVPELIATGATSIKAFTVYGDRLKLDNGDLRSVMQRTAAAGGTMLVHAEDDAIITGLVEEKLEAGETDYSVHGETHPPISETTAMWTVADLVAETDCPTLLVHVSTEGARHVLEHAASRDLPLLAETCPHYLSLTSEVYDRSDGERYVCSPPIRGESHRQELWGLVEDGSISVVNSDHCGYTTAQKKRHRDDITRMPNGLPGVETTAPLLYTDGVNSERISLQRFVELTATNVAKTFGLYPQKGTLTVGSDADIVVFDPDVEWTIHGDELHMATDYSPYEGKEVRGKAETVLVRGKPVLDGGMVGDPVHGKFLEREADSAAVQYRTL